MEAEIFKRDLAAGCFDHLAAADFDAILQGEAEIRHAKIHEQEIDAGAARYTSIAQVYAKMLAEPLGKAVYAASKAKAMGGAIEPSAPVAKAAASPYADDRFGYLSVADARNLGKARVDDDRHVAEYRKIVAAKASEPGAESEDDEPDLASLIADRRYGRTISLEEARRLGPNAGRHVDMSLRGGNQARSPGQRAREGHSSGGESSSSPPKQLARKQLSAEGEERRAYLQSLRPGCGQSVAQFRA